MITEHPNRRSTREPDSVDRQRLRTSVSHEPRNPDRGQASASEGPVSGPESALLQTVVDLAGENSAAGPDAESPFFFPAFADPAKAVALALRFARFAQRHSVPMPRPILALLDFHADRGDAACISVRSWVAESGLVRRSASGDDRGGPDVGTESTRTPSPDKAAADGSGRVSL